MIYTTQILAWTILKIILKLILRVNKIFSLAHSHIHVHSCANYVVNKNTSRISYNDKITINLKKLNKKKMTLKKF